MITIRVLNDPVIENDCMEDIQQLPFVFMNPLYLDIKH